VRDNGNLILRAKIITDDAVILYQVYKTKKDRDKFLHKINKSSFHNTVELDVNEIEYSINKKKFIELLDKIISSDKKIIQHIVKEYQKPGMVIGDPLKDKILIRL
jgi:hypothetical protein